MVDNSLM